MVYNIGLIDLTTCNPCTKSKLNSVSCKACAHGMYCVVLRNIKAVGFKSRLLFA